jgi:hypothetical protein
VGLGLAILNDENTEVRMLKDKEVALLAEYELRVENSVCRKQSKEGGCKKLPLFFGPNKWANLAKAHKSQGGKKRNRIDGRGKQGVLGKRRRVRRRMCWAMKSKMIALNRLVIVMCMRIKI